MFQRLHNLFKGYSKQKQTPLSQTKNIPPTRYVLVLSGGGTRGFYTLGILKAIEES
jgi:predicted acylesterase/phospholipase RssA